LLLFTLTYEFILSLKKQQFAVTHTNCRTEIPTLPNSWVTNTPSVKLLCPQKIASPYIFVKNMTCIKHVSFFLSPVKWCGGGLWQVAVSWALYYSYIFYVVIFIFYFYSYSFL